MSELVWQKGILVHIDMVDLADELEEQGSWKSLTPVSTWFDNAGRLVVEFEGEPLETTDARSVSLPEGK